MADNVAATKLVLKLSGFSVKKCFKKDIKTFPSPGRLVALNTKRHEAEISEAEAR